MRYLLKVAFPTYECMTRTACSSSGLRQTSRGLPTLTASNIAQVGALPRPFDERSMNVLARWLPEIDELGTMGCGESPNGAFLPGA